MKFRIGLAVIFVGVLAVTLLQPPDFRVDRSIVMAAPAEKVFPYFDNHKKFNEWNPWAKMDPEAKDTFSWLRSHEIGGIGLTLGA